MPKGPNEKAAEAKRLYQQGKKLIEIATLLKVPAGTVRRWKSTYGWDGEQIANVQNKANVRNEVSPEVVSVMENPDLTDQQRLFCLYYAKSFNATRSYQKAYGCSYETAWTNGPRLLGNACVKAEITHLKQLRYSRALLEPNDIFQRYMDIAFADITDYVSFGREEQPVMSMFGPVTAEDPVTGETVPVTKTVNVVRARDSGEVDGSILSEVAQVKDGFKVKLLDRMKALEWLADHVDLATEEQRARIDKLRAEAEKTKGPERDAVEDDPITTALKEEIEHGLL